MLNLLNYNYTGRGQRLASQPLALYSPVVLPPHGPSLNPGSHSAGMSTKHIGGALLYVGGSRQGKAHGLIRKIT